MNFAAHKISKKKIIIASVIGIVVIATIVSCFVFNSEKRQDTPSGPNSANAADVSTGIMPELPAADAAKMKATPQTAAQFTTQSVDTGKITAGSKELYLPISNPTNNMLDCYVEIMEGQKVLYTSAIMKPNTYISKIELAQALSIGTHSNVVRYISMYKGRKVACMDTEITIICK